MRAEDCSPALECYAAARLHYRKRQSGNGVEGRDGAHKKLSRWRLALRLQAGAIALATLLANARIELVSLARLGGLATLLADLGVEIGAVLTAHRISALLPNAGEEFTAVLGANGLTAATRLRCAGFRTTLTRRPVHLCHSLMLLSRATDFWRETQWMR